MALKAFISKEEREALDDSVKSHYVDKDGKIVLDVAGSDGWALENVQGLRNSLQSARSERDERTRALSAWTQLGLSPDEVKQKLEEGGKGEKGESLQKELEKERQKLNAKYKQDLEAEQARAKKYQQQLVSHVRENAARAVISKHKGSPDLLLPVVERHTKIEETESGMRLVVVDPSTGSARITQKPGETGNMDLDELVSSWRGDPNLGRAFDGSGQSGGGGSPDGKGTGVRHEGGKKVIAASDQQALNDNVKGLADGSVVVDFGR